MSPLSEMDISSSMINLSMCQPKYNSVCQADINEVAMAPIWLAFADCLFRFDAMNKEIRGSWADIPYLAPSYIPWITYVSLLLQIGVSINDSIQKYLGCFPNFDLLRIIHVDIAQLRLFHSCDPISDFYV